MPAVKIGVTNSLESPSAVFLFNAASRPAACNVLYLNSVETESLTGPQAIAKATDATLGSSPRPAATIVQFKVTSQGITLTDSQRRYRTSQTLLNHLKSLLLILIAKYSGTSTYKRLFM